MIANTKPRRRGEHGAHAGSQRTRRAILSGLVKRALDGDIAAAEAVLRFQADQARVEPVRHLLAGSERA
jgi:hypothetical protein